MLIHKVVKPDFVERFSCVGPECLISCCQGWNIAIDKKTHHAYLNSDNRDIATLAQANLLRTRKGKSNFSVIKLNEEGFCPFIAEDKFCLVQRELGESALSPTCSTYPRLKRRYDDETRHSMTLSCPEVARLVLFEADSMRLHEQESLLAKGKVDLIGQRQSLNQVQQVVHLFVWHLVQAPSRHIEENLQALAQFILYLQRIDFDLHTRFDEVAAWHQQLLADLQSGESLMSEQPAQNTVPMKLRALAVLGTLIANDGAREDHLKKGHQNIATYLDAAEQTDIGQLSEKFAALDKQWLALCEDSCLSAPHVLRNFLTYKIYTSHFPGTDLTTVMRQFYRLVLEYFYLKHILSAHSLQGEVNETLVLKTLASLSEKTMHSATLDTRMNRAIDMINTGDDLSCLLLIG